MKTIITNNDNLTEEEITEVVKRVKALIINSNDGMLLGYSHDTYQFIGGHVEENETLNQTLERKIKEETGMNLNTHNLKPFACLLGYYKNWPSNGKNRKIEIYYYEIKTDEKPDLKNTQYTEDEVDGNFELRYVPFDDVLKELKENAKKYGDSNGIAREMIDLLKIYKRG